jgi:hypothetical protein
MSLGEKYLFLLKNIFISLYFKCEECHAGYKILVWPLRSFRTFKQAFCTLKGTISLLSGLQGCWEISSRSMLPSKANQSLLLPRPFLVFSDFVVLQLWKIWKAVALSVSLLCVWDDLRHHAESPFVLSILPWPLGSFWTFFSWPVFRLTDSP